VTQAQTPALSESLSKQPLQCSCCCVERAWVRFPSPRAKPIADSRRKSLHCNNADQGQPHCSDDCFVPGQAVEAAEKSALCICQPLYTQLNLLLEGLVACFCHAYPSSRSSHGASQSSNTVYPVYHLSLVVSASLNLCITHMACMLPCLQAA
jgi:hypothetical protein